MDFVFFSMNDFSKEGGGTIRMLGIMNELALKNRKILFISNCAQSSHKLFHPSIEHININYIFSRKDKRIFQGMLSVLPIWYLNIHYRILLKHLDKIFKNVPKKDIYFFEYLDNSIGYWLKQNKLISNYINDLHGVATLEFSFQAQSAKSKMEKTIFQAKYFLSKLLDKKVFQNAHSLIFASKAMEEFYKEQFPFIEKKKHKILPYLLSSNACRDNNVDKDLENKLKEKFKIKDHEKIILFAGAFKKTGGIPDLIAAFKKCNDILPETRLFLIGDGPSLRESNDLVKNLKISNKVVFIGRIPYNELRTYQELANIIVCPDKQNVYSELIVHVKYLDALISNKIVINGSFKSVKEINENEKLSLSFEPSNINSLSEALITAIENYDKLNFKYKNNYTFVCKNLTYAAKILTLEE